MVSLCLLFLMLLRFFPGPTLYSSRSIVWRQCFFSPFLSSCPPSPFFWLALHNPHLNWSDRPTESWSLFCLSNCLKSALQSSSSPPSNTTVSPVDLSLVPTEYHDLGMVFSKDKALSLPPQRPMNAPLTSYQGHHYLLVDFTICHTLNMTLSQPE